MKANNLSVSVPNKGCKKNCPYCVSKMTGYTKTDEELFIDNLSKARHLAEMSQVSLISITGKGEPMLNLEMVRKVARRFCDFPVELQTCGWELADDTSLIDLLTFEGVDIFALSMDKWSDFEDMKHVIERINHLNKTVRVTMNVSDMLTKPFEEAGSRIPKFMDYINECKKNGIQQFSFRNLSVPYILKGNMNVNERARCDKTVKWIREHVKEDMNTGVGYYQELLRQFSDACETDEIGMLRDLNYGVKLYTVRGISFTYFNYCVQDSSKNSEDIRSLIYQEDGHMYTTWNSLASRIF